MVAPLGTRRKPFAAITALSGNGIVCHDDSTIATVRRSECDVKLGVRLHENFGVRSGRTFFFSPTRGVRTFTQGAKVRTSDSKHHELALSDAQGQLAP
jgi:hypothetical protein